ncbi:alpha kinase, putative [Trichomonas vaginalis G3]|uniref:Alpha kinase, putative n=1 Tax=Trichomonas vaginalis (strain ATCC PRA-98 / G3) TaxID=412133 RepID=A2E4W3_TRIV3|nr:nuclear chaperone required for maturation and nuclear export of pre-60s ribosome subunits [Trichomonas vaginalis G3]EAY12302.1 alpha kinase, putative [Trichomonas vaginalis G3]KAI5552416.1 nuclear chaperone required for maturation and nuclear export of pre-60s ribosome subunits [Trichomonas vaginalis G3]|eukprot:XP_001324525.1 alpha kinase [Trichomonas vaginalis G3]
MITGAKNISKTLIRYINDKYSSCDVQYSAVFFRDMAMARYVGHTLWNYPDIFDFQSSNFFSPDRFDYVSCGGGAGDGPEDWVQAFDGVLGMNWRSKSKKIMIMITDASCHGNSFDSKLDYTKRVND